MNILIFAYQLLFYFPIQLQTGTSYEACYELASGGNLICEAATASPHTLDVPENNTYKFSYKVDGEQSQLSGEITVPKKPLLPPNIVIPAS
jgi:hypothetical protein